MFGFLGLGFRARRLGNLKALALRRYLSMLKDNAYSKRHVNFPGNTQRLAVIIRNSRF